jgi:hypothetical protein
MIEWLERKGKCGGGDRRLSARATSKAPRFTCDWTSHRRPRSHQHLCTRRNISLTAAIGQYTFIMPADRLLGTLLRSLQVYTDQQDTPR